MVDRGELLALFRQPYCNRIEREYRALLGYSGSLHLLTYEQLSVIDQARFERLAGRSCHFRKGVVGEGKRSLTAAQRQLVHRRLDHLTSQLMEKYSLDVSAYLGAKAVGADGGD